MATVDTLTAWIDARVVLWRPMSRPDRAGAAARRSALTEVALRDSAAELTYGELVHRARSLAARLRAAGVGPGDYVAMAVPKSVHSVAATVATWLAGAVHVPIDPAQPRARQRAILERAAAALDRRAPRRSGGAGQRTSCAAHRRRAPAIGRCSRSGRPTSRSPTACSSREHRAAQGRPDLAPRPDRVLRGHRRGPRRRPGVPVPQHGARRSST